MLRFLLIIVLATYCRLFVLPFFSADIAEKPQAFCLKLIPKSSPYVDCYAAIVCGADLPPGPKNAALRNSGLIHLMVVSGSHLIFLAQLFSSFGIRHRRLTAFLLFSFTCFSGLQAPALRAWIQMQVSFFSRTRRCFMRPPQIVLAAGLICLAFFPDWIGSISFILSWACGLSLSLSSPDESPLRSAVRVYIFLFPILLTFGAPHPVSILMNLFFGNLLGFVLFPASLASLVIPYLASLTDILWGWLFWTLKPFELLARPAAFSLPSLFIWALLLAAHAYFEIRRPLTE